MVRLLEFGAEWCHPCAVLKPFIERLRAEYPSVSVEEIDVDKDPHAASLFGVSGIPTVVLLKDGSEVTRFTGTINRGMLRKELERIV